MMLQMISSHCTMGKNAVTGFVRNDFGVPGDRIGRKVFQGKVWRIMPANILRAVLMTSIRGLNAKPIAAAKAGGILTKPAASPT